ncbi:MAG: DNA-binding protein [Lachnospiraceae bacterium]|nr:DNA-binding protein [Lachnospiraceae bacterium]
MQRATPENKDYLTPAETVDHFRLSRKKFSDWIQRENAPFLIVRYGKRKMVCRVAFEQYLREHPELRRRD